MNLDKLTFYFIVGSLPILWLPLGGISFATLVFIAAAFCLLLNRKWWLVALCTVLAFSYGQVWYIAKKADEQTAYKTTAELKITRLLKQQEYQTAVGEILDGQEKGKQIYLTWLSETQLNLDHIYQAELNIRPISSRLNQGNFNRQRWYFANHIDGISSVRKATLLDTQTLSLRSQWIQHIRQHTDGLATQGLLLALAFGERAWLDNATWRIFQDTTTAHIIAISGLHIALAFGIGFWFAKAIQWGLMRIAILQAVGFSHFFTYAVGFVFAFGYSFLAGFAIPTLRALLAISFVLLCQGLRYHYTAWQLWSRVVAVLIAIDPMNLLSDSFWLSVLAVASLIFWYQHFPLKQFPSPQISKKFPKTYRLLASLIHLQLGIWLVFSPVQLYFFEGTSPYAFLANVIAVPLYSSVLVPLILLGLLTNNVLWSWQVADQITQWSLWLIEPLSHSWITLTPSQQYSLLFVNALILLGLYLFIQQKSVRFSLLVFTAVLGAATSGYLLHFLYQKAISPKNWGEWITFDVGQGLAMALVYQEQAQKKAVLYDTAASWESGSMAMLEILPYLKREGISVEAIFLSHDDNDHSGGVAELLTAYPKAKLFSASLKRYAERQAESCVQGDSWQFGAWHLTAVYPKARVARARNHDSCVLLAEIAGTKILLTGDTGVEQEREFAVQVGKIDFLQVPHHGSKTSTSLSLLEQTQPEMTIVSTGRWNMWKMPNPQIVERLAERNISLFNTAKTGMVKVTLSEKGWKMETARSQNAAWYKGFFAEK